TAQLIRIVRWAGRRKICLLPSRAALEIRVHHIALNRPRPHDGNLNGEIIEFAWPEARQHVYLRAALYLKNANTVSVAQHVINRRRILRHGSQTKIAQPM